MLSQELADRLIRVCLDKGWTIRLHTHPKTRQNWENEPQRKNKGG